MKNFRVILIIGFIEILIGLTTLFTTLSTYALGTNEKSFNVLLFVIISSFISSCLGVGILKFNRIAYHLLLYFASIVAFSKILIFMNIIHLNGELETTIPSFIKNWVSIFYHCFIIYYLQKPDINKIFHK